MTLTNPCDSNVILETRKANIGVVVPEGQHVIDDQNFCMLCRVNVYVFLWNFTTQFFNRNKRSKHCRLCDKCIGTFDHHCIWINNCVGDKNYKSLLTVFLFDVLRSFFTFVGLLFLLVIVDLTIGASLVIEFIVDMSRITTQCYKALVFLLTIISTRYLRREFPQVFVGVHSWRIYYFGFTSNLSVRPTILLSC